MVATGREVVAEEEEDKVVAGCLLQGACFQSDIVYGEVRQFYYRVLWRW